MTRIAIVGNICGAIAVTSAVLVAHGVSDRRGAPAGVLTRPILTVGDSANGYRLVRTPDAIHAYDNGDGRSPCSRMTLAACRDG